MQLSDKLRLMVQEVVIGGESAVQAAARVPQKPQTPR